MANITAQPAFSYNGIPSIDALWNSSPLVVAASSSLVILCTSYIYKLAFTARSDDKTIHALGGFSIANAWRFFTKRGDFLRANFEKGHELYSFKVLQVSRSF